MCSKSCSSSLGNTDVAILFHAVVVQIEDDVDTTLLIDVVQDGEVIKDVDHEIEEDHDVLLYLFPPLTQVHHVHDVVEAEGDQVDDPESENDFENDDVE